MQEIKIEPKPFQYRFLNSQKRFPAIISAVGTGKTFFLLLKIYNYCQQYPGAVALLVRKEFTDLRDSTIKDWERYFKVPVDSNKEYHFKNGSVIMFRHGAELDVLKNLNLSIFGIEQAEEFDTEEQFIFLRDRLRNPVTPYRQGLLIANANGHNWIWRMWINNPSSEEYEAQTATTFDNADNLPADFIADLKRMETEAPAHYRQYVLNDFNEAGNDDTLFNSATLYEAPKVEIYQKIGIPRRILAIDVARFGNDETVYTVIETYGATKWEQIAQQTRTKDSTMETVGRAISMMQEFDIDICVVDEGGVGGGVIDRLVETNHRVTPFDGAKKPTHTERYYNLRSEGYFELKELIEKGNIKIVNDPMLMDQLLSISFKFNSNGTRQIISKDDMRKKGLKSPDRADALMMAVSQINSVLDIRNETEKLPRYYNTEDIDIGYTQLPRFASMA